MKAWEAVNLKDVCKKIGSGATPRGGSSVYLDHGKISLIRSQNVYNEHFNPDGLAFITSDAAEKLKNVIVEKDDVLLNITGDSVARCCLPDPSFLPARVNQHVAIIRPKPDILNSRYLRYFLVSPNQQYLLLSLAGAGGTRKALTKGMIESLEIPLPPLPEQRAIAEVLGSLDDKIALLRRQNETLEAMAQALFQSWFVDFDPVLDKALAAGNPIPEALQAKAKARKALGDKRKPLPEEIAALFPDRFRFEEELGWVPEGWGNLEIGEIVDSVSVTYPLSIVEKVIFLNTGDILNGQFLHKNFSNAEGLPGQAKKAIKKGDILYSEIRPKNKRFALVTFDAGEYVVSTKLMVLRARTTWDPLYAYFIMTQKSFIDHLQTLAESRSGTFPQITFNILSKVKILCPSEMSLIKLFTDNYLRPVFDKIHSNRSNSLILESLRDTLLPQLISGQIRLPEAEDLLKAQL